jgi:pectate lyase
MTIVVGILSWLTVLLLHGQAGASHTPVYGYGTQTPGGDQGPVYLVTNRNNSGAGSLRDALAQGNRKIQFSVSGTIALASAIVVRGHSFITIDGASAPPPGITVTGHALSFRGGSHDIKINNLRIRNTPAGEDCLTLWEGVHNVVVEHLSTKNCGDGAVDITAGAHDVTLAWSILQSTAPADPQGKTSLIRALGADTERITVHHNLFISDGTGRSNIRNPDIGRSGDAASNDVMVDMRNNVIWDWGPSGNGTNVRDGAWANVIGNLYSSPGESMSAKNKHINRIGSVQLHTSGNQSLDAGTVNPNTRGNRPTEFGVPYVATVEMACNAASEVVSDAGAAPMDATDAALAARVDLDAC